jgi:hypothetical protein
MRNTGAISSAKSSLPLEEKTLMKGGETMATMIEDS